MKKFFVFAAIFFSCRNAFSTLQVSDFLIINKDTIQLKSFFLEDLKLQYTPFYITKQTAPHTACWRGYQAYWKIRNDSLFLHKIISCQFKKDPIEENTIELFKKNGLNKYIINNEIAALWCTKTLIRLKHSIAKFNKDIIFLESIFPHTSIKKGIIIQFKEGKMVLNNLKEY